MSIYDNNTSKTYQHLNLTEPLDLHTYHLKELTEIETYLLDEIEVRERLAKKMKRFNTTLSLIDTGLITSTLTTTGDFIAAFASGAGLSVVNTLSETVLRCSFVTVIIQKSFSTVTIKQEKQCN